MKILHYNIGHATGICRGYHEYVTKSWRYLFGNKKALVEFVRLIRSADADLVYLVETKKGGLTDQFKQFSSSLNYPVALFLSKYSKLAKKMPFTRGGCAIFSRTRLKNKKTRLFSVGFNKRKFFQFDISNDVSLFFLHLSLGKKARKKQIEELTAIIQKNKKKVIIVGDLNTFNGASELIRLIKECKLKITNVNHTPTFPAWKPSRELDYILVSKDIAVKSFKVLNYKLSDHLPILIEVKL